MSLPLRFPYPPMEAESVPSPAGGREWQYEPKWDGFRCLAFRDGESVQLQSKAGKPLARYFPDVVESLGALRPARFVLDGEIVIPVDGRLSFDELLLRVHPGGEPGADAGGRPTAHAWWCSTCWWTTAVVRLWNSRSSERRERLEAFAKRHFPGATVRSAVARHATASAPRGLARRRRAATSTASWPSGSTCRTGRASATGWSRSSASARRTAWSGGFRYASKGGGIGSLLLGLFDAEGR